MWIGLFGVCIWGTVLMEVLIMMLASGRGRHGRMDGRRHQGGA